MSENTFPLELNAGDTFSVDFDVPDSVGAIGTVAAVKVLLRGGTEDWQETDITSRDSDGNFSGKVVAPNVDGRMDWRVIALNAGGERCTILSGSSLVRGGYNTTQTPDERDLAALETVRNQRITGRGDTIQYSLGGRSVSAMSAKDLEDWIQRLRNRIDHQRRGGKFRRHFQ